MKVQYRTMKLNCNNVIEKNFNNLSPSSNLYYVYLVLFFMLILNLYFDIIFFYRKQLHKCNRIMLDRTILFEIYTHFNNIKIFISKKCQHVI